MNTVHFIALQEMENSRAYKLGYEVGYFIGSNFWEVVITALVILASILYFAFFRKRKKNIG